MSCLRPSWQRVFHEAGLGYLELAAPETTKPA